MLARALGGKQAAWVAGIVPGAWFVWFASMLGDVSGGAAIVEVMPWAPSLELHLAFRLDGLALLFALLITGIGAVICAYAGGYLGDDARFGRFLATLLSFMAAMLGIVISDDLILAFAFWELTSITSFLLIGFGHEREAARAAAMRALIITGAGGLALLAGFVLMGIEAGTFRISELPASAEGLSQSPLYGVMLALVCLGCFTKSAQWPFHFWLPGAMEAPAPVSAYLHSATMVKAGVFMLARLNPALGDTLEWSWTLSLVGGTTMVYAALMAARSTRLKQVLALTTVSALGTMTMLLGLGVPGDAAAMTFLLAHAMYKGSLFMVAGIMEKKTGEYDAEHISGLARAMPLTAATAMLAGTSLVGIPPLFGFVGKYLMKDALERSPWSATLVAAVVVMGACMTAAALVVAFRPFVGQSAAMKKQPHEAGASLLLGPMLLALGGLIAGVMPGLFADSLVLAATDAVTGSPGEAELSALHLFSPSALVGSTGIALALGVGLFFARRVIRQATGVFDRLGTWDGAGIFDRVLSGVLSFGALQTRVIQHGSLNGYVRTCILGLLAIGGGLLVGRTTLAGLMPRLDELLPFEAVLVALLMAGALSTTMASRRLSSVVALGVVGIAAAMVFVIFGAPDVSMTQFAIETLTVLILVLVFYHLPPFRVYTSHGRRVADWIISFAFGGLMTLLLLLAVNSRMAEPISSYFAGSAYTEGKGRNVVNVIIVDFRAMDTFGELFVLLLAGAGVVILLTSHRRATLREARHADIPEARQKDGEA